MSKETPLDPESMKRLNDVRKAIWEGDDSNKLTNTNTYKLTNNDTNTY